MTCNECQQELTLVESQNEVSEAARRHLAVCATCQDFVRDAERLRVEVHKVAESERAPQALHEQVQKVIRGRMEEAGRPRQRWIAAAAVVIFLVLIGYGLRWNYFERALSPDRLAQQFIADHLHYLPGREQVVSSSAPDIEKWFQGRVDFPVRVPAVSAAALEDARVCTIAGRKAALLHYRHKPDDTLVSLFIAEAPPPLRRLENSVAVSASNQGCNAALWSRRGLVYSLVATLDEAHLKQMVELLRQQQP